MQPSTVALHPSRILLSKSIFYNITVFLGPNRSNSSIALSENNVALSNSSASSETDSEPDGEGSSLEEENGGENACTEAKTGLDEGVRNDDVPLC